MCVVSFIGDHYGRKYTYPVDVYPSQPWGPFPSEKETLPDIARRLTNNQTVTREEFDKLKESVKEMKELLIKAIEYDKRTGQPECENEDKIKLLRSIAKLVGVELPI